MKPTLVLGASVNPARYSNMAIQRLLENGIEVSAIGRKSGVAFGIPILSDKIEIANLNTITLYLNANNQKEYYDYILKLKPSRIIFNPGTENIELKQLAEAQQIECIEACTLVMLSTNQY